MSIKILAMTTAALSLFATEAFAQANHNTSRSNKTTGGVTAPANPDAQSVVSDAITKEDRQHIGHVTLIKIANEGDFADETAVKSNTTGSGNTANGYQALSLQGAPGEGGGNVTGHITIQNGLVNNPDETVLTVEQALEACREVAGTELQSCIDKKSGQNQATGMPPHNHNTSRAKK